jgi:hypothetical protein
MEQLRSLALNNNTTGASIYDLGNIIKAESIAEITHVLKAAEDKVQQQKQAEMQQQQQMQQEMLAAQEKARQEQIQAEALRDDKMIQKDITVAEIRSAGYGAAVDLNQNQMSDYQDAMKDIRQQSQYSEQMNFKREQEVNKTRANQDKLAIDREKIRSQENIAQKQLEIARVNKNKYDVQKKEK